MPGRSACTTLLKFKERSNCQTCAAQGQAAVLLGGAHEVVQSVAHGTATVLAAGAGCGQNKTCKNDRME